MPGFPGVAFIPLGRLQTSPIPLLARGALLPRHLHPRTGDIHGRPKRRAQEAILALSAKPKKPAKPRKSLERSLPVPVPASAAALSVINPDAAGIDVHSNMHMVCVPADRDANPVRQFGADTAYLQEIVRG